MKYITINSVLLLLYFISEFKRVLLMVIRPVCVLDLNG